MKKYHCIVMVFFILSFLRPLPLSAETDGKSIVARVNGVAITTNELARAIDTYVPPGTYHRELGMQKRKEYRKPALDMLIERELLSQEASARKIPVKKDEVSSALKNIQDGFRSKADFQMALRNTGVTLDEYKAVLKRNLAIDKLLKAEVEDKSGLSDKELAAYYSKNKEKFLKPETFKVWHILVKIPSTATEKERDEKKALARDLLKRIRGGESFADIATKYSSDDYRIKGGDLGWVHKGRLEAALDAALATLNPGDTVLVETAYGVHILRLDAKNPPEQVSFDEVKGALKKDQEEKRRQDNKAALIDSLKKKARIEVFGIE